MAAMTGLDRARCGACNALMSLDVARAADRCPRCGAYAVDYGAWIDPADRVVCTDPDCPDPTCRAIRDGRYGPFGTLPDGTIRDWRIHARVVFRKMYYSVVGLKVRRGQSVCDAACVHATSVDCRCSCGGANHGMLA